MEVQTILKAVGAGMSGLGSILLAWRVKSILTWVVYCIVAHDASIEQLRRILNSEQQTSPIIEGTSVHLLETQDKVGFIFLVGGFLLLGIGMLLNMASILCGFIR